MVYRVRQSAEKKGLVYKPRRQELLFKDILIEQMTVSSNNLKQVLEFLKEREIENIAREKQYKAREEDMKSTITTNDETIAFL